MRLVNFFNRSFSECADTGQNIRSAGSVRKAFCEFNTFQASDSNPGRLGRKHERYLCAICDISSFTNTISWIQIGRGSYTLGSGSKERMFWLKEIIIVFSHFLISGDQDARLRRFSISGESKTFFLLFGSNGKALETNYGGHGFRSLTTIFIYCNRDLYFIKHDVVVQCNRHESFKFMIGSSFQCNS